MIDATMNQYMLLLGDFDLENFNLYGRDSHVWVLFIFMTFILQIVYLNILIAIMGDTFDKTQEIQGELTM